MFVFPRLEGALLLQQQIHLPWLCLLLWLCPLPLVEVGLLGLVVLLQLLSFAHTMVFRNGASCICLRPCICLSLFFQMGKRVGARSCMVSPDLGVCKFRLWSMRYMASCLHSLKVRCLWKVAWLALASVYVLCCHFCRLSYPLLFLYLFLYLWPCLLCLLSYLPFLREIW